MAGPSNINIINLAVAQRNSALFNSDIAISDILLNTELITAVIIYRVKIAKPDYYHGDRNQLKIWLNPVKIWFIFNPVPENDRTMAASTFLRG